MIVGNALIALIAALTVWISAVMVRRIRSVVLKAPYRRLYLCELALCAVLLAFALDVRFGLFGPLLRVIVTALSMAIALLLLHTAVIGLIDTSGSAAHALVLGAALENGRPTRELIGRLDAAQDYLHKYPDAALILSGGNPDASGATEAAIMQRLLTARGVPANKMLIEDGSSTTEENFINAAKLVDPSRSIVLITSGYHMARALRCAKAAGFTRVLRRPAPSDPLRYGPNLMSEAALRIRDALLARRS